MHIIPVLDIKDGLVVGARMGNRDAYQPIETLLSPTADVLDVADGLSALYPFPAFYVADLDAIQHPASAETALHRVKPLPARADIWLDAGFGGPQQLEHALAVGGIWPILGSELQADASVLERFRDNPRLILSLDFRGDAFLGPSSILENTDNWPSRIIVMTLRRIGADTGPDFDRAEINAAPMDVSSLLPVAFVVCRTLNGWKPQASPPRSWRLRCTMARSRQKRSRR